MVREMKQKEGAAQQGVGRAEETKKESRDTPEKKAQPHTHTHTHTHVNTVLH